MSVANGFMRGDDINWLQGELPNLAPIILNNKQLKPLSNLYIVASQAHTVSNGSIDVLNTIYRKAQIDLNKHYHQTIGITLGKLQRLAISVVVFSHTQQIKNH